jgi:hypothetical protein
MTILPDMESEDGVQLEPQFVPPHVRDTCVRGVLEEVLDCGVVEEEDVVGCRLGCGVSEVVGCRLGCGVSEVVFCLQSHFDVLPAGEVVFSGQA